MQKEAKTIVDLCALAELPDLAGEFIAQGMTADSVRQELLAKRAKGPEIQSHIMPGQGDAEETDSTLKNNPVVAACQKLSGNPVQGG